MVARETARDRSPLCRQPTPHPANNARNLESTPRTSHRDPRMLQRSRRRLLEYLNPHNENSITPNSGSTDAPPLDPNQPNDEDEGADDPLLLELPQIEV